MKNGETKFTPIVSDISDDKYSLIENIDDGFLIETNENAPNGKVMKYLTKSKSWQPFLPEKPEPLTSAGTAGGKLFAEYSKDVSLTRIRLRHAGQNAERSEAARPGLGGRIRR